MGQPDPCKFQRSDGRLLDQVERGEGDTQARQARAVEARHSRMGQKEFGGNVVNLVLHLDEKTPHAHLLAVPHEGGQAISQGLFNPATATRWQDDYAKATKLKR